MFPAAAAYYQHDAAADVEVNVTIGVAHAPLGEGLANEGFREAVIELRSSPTQQSWL